MYSYTFIQQSYRSIQRQTANTAIWLQNHTIQYKPVWRVYYYTDWSAREMLPSGLSGSLGKLSACRGSGGKVMG